MNPISVRYSVVDNKITEYCTVVVFTYEINYPALYNIGLDVCVEQFSNSEEGLFVREHSTPGSVKTNCYHNHERYTQVYCVIAELTSIRLTEFLLRFGNKTNT